MRKGLIILGDLLDQDLLWLAENGAVRALAPGQQLMKQGQHITELYFITEGQFEVSTDGAQLPKLGVGDVLGEVAFVEKAGAIATVTALEDARALAVPQAALTEKFQDDTGFAARFYRALAVFLADRLRDAVAQSETPELDEGLLDTLHVAGDRLLRLIGLLEGQEPS